MNSAGDRGQQLQRGSTTSPRFQRSIESARGSYASRTATFRNTIPSLEKNQQSNMRKRGLQNHKRLSTMGRGVLNHVLHSLLQPWAQEATSIYRFVLVSFHWAAWLAL